MARFARFLATGAYLGCRFRYPGTTAGSALAFLGYVIYRFLAPLSPAGEGGASAFSAVLVVGLPLAFTLLGVWAAGVAEKIYGHDASPIVIDEMAGMWVALLFLPAGIGAALASFFVFRFFDIVKPFPAGRSQRLPGGWGIMADDIIAGIYANLVTRAGLLLLS